MREVIRGPWKIDTEKSSETMPMGVTQRYGAVVRKIDSFINENNKSERLAFLGDLKSDLNDAYQVYFLDRDRLASNMQNIKYSKKAPKENLLDLINYAEYFLESHKK